MRIIRGSEYSDFMRCRYRWAERWINQLAPVKQNGKLLIGSLIHKWLEHYYRDGLTAAYDAMGKMFAETDVTRMEQTELDDLWGMCQDVVKNYYEYYKDRDADIKTTATELSFIIPLDDEIALSGTIDLVYENKDGYLWFADHKTTASIEMYEKISIMDRQISRYWWALQKLTDGIGYVMQAGEYLPVQESLLYHKIAGRKVQGFMYNLILKEVPKAPKVLKNGSLSKDKSQKTTYDLYMKALIEIGMEPPKDSFHEGHHIIPKEHEYFDILVHLAEQENRYFRRVDVTRLQPELNASIKEFYATGRDLKDVATAIVEHGATELAYRTITKDCHWDCPYLSICHTGISGGDVSQIRNTQFTQQSNQLEGEIENA